MHSSRMRTARSLTTCRNVVGGVRGRGTCMAERGVRGGGGVHGRGGIVAGGVRGMHTRPL